MDRDSVYYRQVELLVRIMPFVAKEKCLALNRIVENLTNVSPRYNARLLANHLKIMIDGGGFLVKIEVSDVLRGTLHEPENRDIHPTVEEGFGYANISVASVPDLYGGKICASLNAMGRMTVS